MRHMMSTYKNIKLRLTAGLDHSEIGDLRNFQHLKEQFPSAKGSESKAKLRCDYNASIDFLESIENDIPKGTASIVI